jgi:Ser/Thr protein kinase RdoA (MazF antagonist)
VKYGPHVLKVYRDRLDFEDARWALRFAARLKTVHVPAYEGSFTARQTTVQEWVPGHTPSLWPGSSEAAGEVLAALHGDDHQQLPRLSAKQVLAKAAVRADFVTRLLPDLEFEVDALLADLRLTAPKLPRVISHGNFHAGQLRAGPDGLVVLDVDRLCRAAAAYDLASYVSHTVFGRPGDRQVLEATLDSLVKGYGASPAGLEWYLAACLLRRAAVPFRFQDECWPEASTALVHLAREVVR